MTPDHRELNVRVIEQCHLSAGKHVVDRRGEKQRGVSGFIKDPDKSITDLLAETGKTLGDTLSIERFARFAVGEELKA